MSNGVATRRAADLDDECDGYVMIDARALILDVPAEARPPAARPPMRGVQAQFEAERWREDLEWRGLLGAKRRQAIAEASASVSMWQRLGRKLQEAWSGSTPKR